LGTVSFADTTNQLKALSEKSAAVRRAYALRTSKVKNLEAIFMTTEWRLRNRDRNNPL
jgi:hypothetical protein